jgi:hypothetical protein
LVLQIRRLFISGTLKSPGSINVLVFKTNKYEIDFLGRAHILGGFPKTRTCEQVMCVFLSDLEATTHSTPVFGFDTSNQCSMSVEIELIPALSHACW